MTDQQALDRYATQADMDAFQHLVDTYQRLVYAACRRQLQAEADVEDAVQETFLRLAKHAGNIRKNLAGWLHTCATHVAITRIRRDATRRRHELAWTPVDDPQAAQTSHDLMAEVDAALEQLKPADRELILRYYLQGQTQASLAHDQGLSQPGLKYRLDRATDRLRKKLQQRGVTTTAAALGAFFLADAAQAQVPASLTVGLTKLGLGAAAKPLAASTATAATSTATSTATHPLLNLATSKIALATTAAVVVTAGSIGLLAQRHHAANPAPTTAAQNAGNVNNANPQNPPLDPAFNRPMILPTGQANGQHLFLMNVQEHRVTFRMPGVTQTLEVLNVNPDANPATLELKIVDAQGPAAEPMQDDIGKVLKLLYRLEDQGQRMVSVHTFPGGDAPRSFPDSFAEAAQRQLEVGVFVRAEPADPNQDPTGPLGVWNLVEPTIVTFTQDRMFAHDILDPDAGPVGEFIIREWKTDTRPRRLGGVWKTAPGHVAPGTAQRWIYETDPASGDITLGRFFPAPGVVFAGQYPNSMNDPRLGFMTQRATPFEK